MNIITRVEPYRSTLERIKQIALTKPVKYVPGNHDWHARMHASLLKPVEIVAAFSEDGIYFCHGHDTSWLGFTIGTPVDPVYWRKMFPFILPPLEFMWAFDKWRGLHEDVYSRSVAILHEAAARYAQKHGYNSIVFGHSHYPSIKVIEGINVYNAGDLLDSYSYLVQENGNIELLFF